jgi:hypothetical protein
MTTNKRSIYRPWARNIHVRRIVFLIVLPFLIPIVLIWDGLSSFPDMCEGIKRIWLDP